ncbi:hypothetical protein KFU94_47300 [Chloroflexi bacterium TSY]|nr:hypothetical protein [Chloroflexi bacterium TSY]
MSPPNPLHWSFNHDNRQQTPYFAEQLLNALQNLPTESEFATNHYPLLSGKRKEMR